MNTTATMRHLSAIGSGDALAVFVWLVSAGQPMQQGWVEAMTGISDKNVSRALRKLKELQYAVQTTQGWAVAPAMAEQGVLGDVLTALPGEPAHLADQPAPAADTTLEQLDERIGHGQTTTLREAYGNSDSGSYGGGGVLSNTESKESFKHQQHHENQSGNSGWLTEDSPENLPAGDPDRGRARLALLRLGCWPNQVQTIMGLLHPERGLGDVLGWIAYSQDSDQGVNKPAAVVAGKLKRQESPPSAWIAPRICAACHRVDGRCLCPEPDYHYPTDYDELAFEPPPSYGRDDWLANRWRCARCFGHPCQCESDDPQEQEQ